MRVSLIVTVGQVRAEAERRILARYPLWRQLNLIRQGGPEGEAMGVFIDHIRACSNRLEGARRIPPSYAGEEHWQ